MLQDSVLESFISDPNHRLRKALEDNDLYDWLPKAPVHMLYCDGDDQVNYLNSVIALDAFEANGLTNVFAQNLGDGDHGECVTPALFRCKTLMDETRKLNLGIELSSNIADETGSIQLEIIGGHPPFSYQWSSGDQTENVENLLPGAYSLTISDSFGCEEEFDFEIEGSTASESIKNQPLKIIPNPSNGHAYLSIPHSLKQVDLEIFNAQGKLVFKEKYSGDKIILPVLDEPGIYFIKVTGNTMNLAKWVCN